MPVLDASALLAYLGDEAGADVVADAISGGVTISTVNLSESLSTLATRGNDPVAVASELTSRGLLDGAITVEAFTAADAIETGRLRPLTQGAGLSLADRACLAARSSPRRLGADRRFSMERLEPRPRRPRDLQQRPLEP